ncbi:MAG TPA: NADP-specific glutamate dehydrogenase, partial [Nitratifractor sp.]|nr:NADP-specific glutamate dehydrogenase [Nitratifractor sp.]
MVDERVEYILNDIKMCSPGQTEFYQAAQEVLESIRPLLECESKYFDNNILEHIV